MIAGDDIRCPDIAKIEIARFRNSMFHVHHPSELIIRIVIVRQLDGSREYQLRCRSSCRGDGKYWIRSVDRGNIERALETLRGSMVPAIPEDTGICGGHEVGLTLAYDSHPITYSWGLEPPSGYESLVRFANRLERWAGVSEVLGYGHELNAYLTEEALADLAGRKIFARGVRYYEAGNVTRLYEVDGELRATVIGTETYPVKLWVEDGELHYRCGCPMGARALCCKHVVAAGLAWVVEI